MPVMPAAMPAVSSASTKTPATGAADTITYASLAQRRCRSVTARRCAVSVHKCHPDGRRYNPTKNRLEHAAVKEPA